MVEVLVRCYCRIWLVNYWLIFLCGVGWLVYGVYINRYVNVCFKKYMVKFGKVLIGYYCVVFVL